jgi:hypothetical protein
VNLHFHVVFLEGVYLDRSDQGLTPRFVKADPPSDADIAMVLQKISHRVIRKLRRLGYLEAGMEVPVATGYDPLLDNEPELARSMAASVRQRIAFGERAGEKVRRIGSGFGYEGERPELTGPRCASVNGFSLHANTAIPAHRRNQLERLMRYTGRGAVSLERLEQDTNGDLIYRFTRPWSDGTTGMKLSPLELLEKRAAIVPLPRVHLVRYAGCLAPHSKLRPAIIPTPRQQGIDGDASKIGTPYWNWARLLGRVFNVDMATCPFCRRGSLRIIAAILPPLRGRREPCDLHARISDHPDFAPPSAGLRSTSHCPGPPSPRDVRVRRSPRQRGLIGDVRAAAAHFAPLRCEIPFEIAPPLLFKPAISRPWRPETPEALSQPILSGVPRARKAVPRLATSRFRRQERRAGEAADTASRQRLPAEAGQRRAVQLGAKKWLSFTYTSPPIRH